MKKLIYILLGCSLVSLSFVAFREKPVLYIIGDSTVKNGSGKGSDALWGWGSLIDSYFDSTRISIENRAIGGRSSRTFITEGRWDTILKTLKKGDYVLMQFGHNDAGPLDDTSRARGTIKGIGTESKDIYNPIRKINETVYTYGHYMRRYIREAKEKGAVPIVCSPVPRNNFKDGKTKRGDQDYGLWSKQVAAEEHALFIDLNALIADAYDTMGADEVDKFFPKDHTHPNKEGSTLNAAKVVEGIKALNDSDLKKYLKQ
ncbi:rhamnogalacturonan acetylesterase [Niabella hibiscisoli]|uniref:rhamnogalacturonan acetylesterase n=1 Tax=Niabella hibiscisoli TaxID=1825928 RepID=UPI001F0FF57C|nr:rhamnogalacturonan acetylesterase [Niabella hibiscisoli]MCH5718317.1 rhamnogalacturonan acetylesterase [Niabella hibiscisoli]